MTNTSGKHANQPVLSCIQGKQEIVNRGIDSLASEQPTAQDRFGKRYSTTIHEKSSCWQRQTVRMQRPTG